MKEVIEKAIEGGYDPRIFAPNIFGSIFDEFAVWDEEGAFFYLTHAICLDPAFWQALGKSLGWEEKGIYVGNSQTSFDRVWLQYWHRFVDALSEGKSPDDFFSALLANK